MDQIKETKEPIGYWYAGQVLCPWCFERQHSVHEGVIPPYDLVGLVTRCALCNIPLWALQELEKERGNSRKVLLKPPLREVRSRRGWTKAQLAPALETSKRIITMVEEGKMRLPDKFYRPLAKIGEDPGKIAVNQEKFIRMLKATALR